VTGDSDLPRSGHQVDNQARRLLAAHPSSVGIARTMVRDVLTVAQRDDLIDTAQLLVSEVVTNALVHAGTPIGFHASVGDGGLRVEVTDGSTQVPAPRRYAPMAGTGRGLGLLQQLVDRWGTRANPDGKTVWFELDSGDRLDRIASSAAPRALGDDSLPDASGEDVVDVVLLNIPLLLHAAWQEHAEGLLREYLLIRLDTDEPTAALEEHAAASDAISVLHEHIPAPHLGEDAEELMAYAVEPGVSSRRAEVAARARAAARWRH
jgi:anti-sigma regulatory factor (Ser/Thr protein kinase)